MTVRRLAEVFPPGEFLQEELEARGWAQNDLATIIGRPAKLVSEIIAGKRSVTPETAKGLAAAFGTTPDLWMNLESMWQLSKAKADDGGVVERRARIYGVAPIKEMLRRGWLETSASVDVLEKQILDFFEVETLEDDIRFPAHAARKSTSYADVTPSQNAWLFRARKLARAVHAGIFSPSKVDEVLERLSSLIHTPEEVRHIPKILAEAGIRFVIIEALPGSRIDGACFWLDGSPVIAMSLRFDRIDNFWFTLLHEVGHVLDAEHELAVDVDLQDEQAKADRAANERAADTFASEHLIRPELIENFIARIRPLYSLARILAFAQLNQIHPGIVVGQLQSRGEVPWSRFRNLLVPVRKVVTDSALTDGWGMSLPTTL